MDIQFLDVIPLIACEDIAVTHEFLVDALGFDSAGLERDGTGQVVHGEVRAGDRRIWLHMTTAEADLATPTTLGGSGGGNVIQVVDVDAHYERARAAGATILSEPTDQEYGQREYGVRDPDGHSWWFATPTAPPAGR
jgi:MerR family transcriptional regulator, thiopeptide resistance regulator